MFNFNSNNPSPNSRYSMYSYIQMILKMTMLTMLTSLLLTMPIANVNTWMKMYNGNRDLKICFQNVPGILKDDNIHMQIDDVIDDLHPDILGLAEPTHDELKIAKWPGYNLVKGTINGYESVRVNALIKAGIQYTVEEWNLDVPTVVIKLKTLILVYVYREWAQAADKTTRPMPQQVERWKKFLNKIISLKGTKKDIIIQGDMNFDFWVDNTQYQRTLDPIRDLTNDKLISLGWNQWIQENTRYQKNQQPSCIDHLYTRLSAPIHSVINQDVIGYDHHAIGCSYRSSLKLITPVIIERRNLEGIDIEAFNQVFYQHNPDEIFHIEDPDRSLAMFCHKLKQSVNILAPKEKIVIKTRNQAQYMTRELLERRDMRKGLYEMAKQNDTQVDWRTYKVFRNALNIDMLQRKRAWLRGLMTATESPAELWKLIKSVGDSTLNMAADITLKVEGGEVIDHPKDVAQYLNKYFLRKVENIKKETPIDPEKSLDYTLQYIRDKRIPTMEFSTVTPQDVSKIIAGLKNTKALGIDDISTQILKKFNMTLAPYITHIVNKALYTSTYPSMWKTGIVSPVPKKGDLTLPQNWRPVTLLCSMSKILETIMNRQLKKHIETNNLLSKNQHAYQTAKSCSTAWADIDVFVNQALDKNKLVPALLLDMSAAFNLVSRHIIVPKLKLLGVGPYAAQLVDSYLTGRQNVTKIKQYMSEYVKVHTGIGEGSVLGPLIFILTIVCLQAVLERVKDRVQQALGVNVSTDPLWSETDVIKLMQTIFADDCTPMAACDTVEQAQTILEIMLDEYTQYFKSNGLKVNFTKCEHVIFSRQSRPRTVKMGDRMEASHVKLLGLTVSNTYTFDKHVSLVTARMTARLPYLARLKPLLEPSKMRQVSEAVSLSVMRSIVALLTLNIKSKSP